MTPGGHVGDFVLVIFKENRYISLVQEWRVGCHTVDTNISEWVESLSEATLMCPSLIWDDSASRGLVACLIPFHRRHRRLGAVLTMLDQNTGRGIITFR